jgi:hypothetical protein
MSRLTLIGVQLPPDSTGKITAGFPVKVMDDSGNVQTVYVPGTFLANALGEEIGGEMLDTLKRIADSLENLEKNSEFTLETLQH